MKGSHMRPRWTLFSGVFVLLAACAQGADAPAGREMLLHGDISRVRGFDPVKAGDVASALAIAHVYEGLVQYSFLARPYRVEPALAESMPEVSTNGLTYTFKIRKGIYFLDDRCFTNTTGRGRELVADDFIYSFKRLADPKNQSTGYWAFSERIAGLDEFRDASGGKAPTDYSRNIEGLQAPDKYTFRMKLTKPYPQLLWVLTMQYAFAVPREAVDFYGKEFINHPVGTGPYVLHSWQRLYRAEYRRNPKWAETGRRDLYPSEGEESDKAAGWLADAGKPIPFVDRIVEHVIEDGTTQWLKFLRGELESSGVSRDNWNAVISPEGMLTDDMKDQGIRLFTRPTLDVYYLGFNMDDPVVGGNPKAGDAGVEKRRKLRQALTSAFNSEEWIKYWNRRIVRAKGPIPPGVDGSNEKPAAYPFDIEKAKRLLVEAGYPDGKDPATGRNLQITIELGSADPQTREAMELVVSFMKKIGIILKPNYSNWPTFLSMMERRQCQMYWLGWVADYPDAENFLQLFYGQNCSPGPNHSNYVNPEFDAMYEKIRVMSDSPERTAIYRKMADIVVEDSPWVFMHHPMAYGLHHCWVRNNKPHDFPYGMVKYRKMDVEQRELWRKTGGKKWAVGTDGGK